VRGIVIVAALAAAIAASAAGAAPAARISFEDVVQPGKSLSLSVSTHEASSFRVVLRIPRQGRAQLFLTGRNAPRGGPLLDTRASGCRRTARARFCTASYEPLPSGVYRWRVRWLGFDPANIQLTVRW
jgi:hypothetical protein